jgi:hypothetical protein
MSIYVACLQTYYTNLYHTIPSPSQSSKLSLCLLAGSTSWAEYDGFARQSCDLMCTLRTSLPFRCTFDYMIRFLQLNLKRTLSRRTIGTLELLSPAHIFGVQHSERKLPQRNGTEWKGSDCAVLWMSISLGPFFFLLIGITGIAESFLSGSRPKRCSSVGDPGDPSAISNFLCSVVIFGNAMLGNVWQCFAVKSSTVVLLSVYTRPSHGIGQVMHLITYFFTVMWPHLRNLPSISAIPHWYRLWLWLWETVTLY